MSKLKKIYIEITNGCNLSCSFCHKTKREVKFMSLENFEILLHKIKPYTNYIYMHIMGEPLLHPEISGFLDLCYEYKIFANITTNGTLIEEKGESIINKPALRQINFSVHSFENLDYENFLKYINSIFNFIDMSKKDGRLISCLRVWNINENKENDLKKLDIVQEIEKKYGFKKGELSAETKGNGIKLSDNVFLQHSKVFSWPDVNNDEIFLNGSCFGLKSHFGILVSGEVVPCCLDCEGDIILGNVFETDLSEILASKRAVNIAEGFRNKIPKEKLCKTCGWNIK